MSVYVDDMYAGFGRMKMCHMWADSSAELVAMADAIGVARKWLQHPGHPVKEHFDIAMSKRVLAVQNGAIKKSWEDYGEWAGYKRDSLPPERCASTSPQGLRCGLDAWHKGSHRALIPDDARWVRAARSEVSTAPHPAVPEVLVISSPKGESDNGA